VLIKVQPGREEEILKILKGLDIKAKLVFGDYDIVAEVETKTREELGTIISTKIRTIEGIESTNHLLAVED
jgi:DNA-binding Lrp family transcriptional regulator